MASGYSADLIKSYFYDRVFGYRDGPEPMDEDEASKLTVHNGQTKTFADVRRYVLDIIDELSMVCLKQVKREHEHEARVQLAAHGKSNLYMVHPCFLTYLRASYPSAAY